MFNVNYATHVFTETMNCEEVIVEDAVRSLLSMKYGEKYRSSLTVSRLSDLAMKFAEAKRHCSENPANISTLDLARELLGQLMGFCRESALEFQEELIKKIEKVHGLWEVGSLEELNALNYNNDKCKYIKQQLEPTAGQDRESDQYLKAVSEMLKYAETPLDDVKAQYACLDSHRGLGMMILAWKSGGIDSLIPCVEVGGEGSMDFFNDDTVCLSIAGVKKSGGGVSSCVNCIHFIAVALNICFKKLSVVLADAIIVTDAQRGR
ncbi:hypothetical protein MP638_003350 [Amoeboaphelidium occidentale]|nr:hypothetical protein MP638_003350 [Amoeboaphelidium occidentale]